jgi:hypothetical protein
MAREINIKSAGDITFLASDMRAQVRARVDDLNARQRKLDESPDWAREPNAERILWQDRKRSVEDAETALRSLVRAARDYRSRAHEAHAEAHRRVDRRVKPERVAELREDMESRLRLAQPSIAGGDTRLRMLAGMMRDAEAANDPSMRRAVRLVGASLLDGRGSSEPDLHRDVTRRLQGFVDDERAEIDAAAAEAQAADEAVGELRRSVRAAGDLLTGITQDQFGGPQGFTETVLGERMRYDGTVEVVEG